MAIASPNPLLEAAVESIEIEAFAEKIPDLVYHGTTTYSLFKKSAHTVKVSQRDLCRRHRSSVLPRSVPRAGWCGCLAGHR